MSTAPPTPAGASTTEAARNEQNDRSDRTRPRAPLWARLVLTLVGMIVAASASGFAALVPGLAEGLPSDLTSGDPATVLRAVTVAWTAVLAAYVLVAWLLTRGLDRRPLADTGWRFDRRSLPGLALGVALALPLTVGSWYAGHAAGWLPDGPGGSGVVAPGAPLWIAVAAVILRSFVLQGIGEELLWRGYVMQTLRARPMASVWVSAVGFTLPHLLSQAGQSGGAERLLYLVLPFGFSLLGAALVLRTGSLWSAVGVHGGVHVGVAVATALGLGEGPAASTLIGVTTGLVGLALLATLPAEDRSPRPGGPFAPRV